MKDVSKILLFILISSISWGQNTSEKLKKEQDRLENKIADTKLLLNSSKSKTATSLGDLQVLRNQITFREELLRNYDNQIRSSELKMQTKEEQIAGLKRKVSIMKEKYKKLLVYAYKNRNKYGRMMFIFASASYYEAIKRSKYIKQISVLQQKQFEAIKQNQKLINSEIEIIDNQRKAKIAIIGEKKNEKLAIENDKDKQLIIYEKLKAEEETLLTKLKREEQNKAILKTKIASAIRKEIAEAEARRKREEEERRKEELAKAKKENKTDTKEKTTTTSEKTFTETKESALVSKGFEGNKGRLPWPVDKGTITEKFGKNPHPTLKNVQTNNNGVDISAPKNSQVRSVFEGEVTSVLSIPGAGKVVIIKHGNYRTVYSNLKETHVSKGDKVKMKKVIGSLLVQSNEQLSVAHFEIHKVVGSTVTCLNPSLWVSH